MSKPRDVVVVRVSEKGDREDEHFHSPEVQIQAAMRWARDRGEQRGQQIREADKAIERANTDLDNTTRQLGDLGLLGRPASQETLGKLTTALDDAHIARARLGHGSKRNIIGPDDIDKLSEPAKRLAAWRRLIANTVELVTVAPAMTADGRPSRLWDPRRIDIRFLEQQFARDPVERALDLRADTPRYRQHR